MFTLLFSSFNAASFALFIHTYISNEPRNYSHFFKLIPTNYFAPLRILFIFSLRYIETFVLYEDERFFPRRVPSRIWIARVRYRDQESCKSQSAPELKKKEPKKNPRYVTLFNEDTFFFCHLHEIYSSVVFSIAALVIWTFLNPV